MMFQMCWTVGWIFGIFYSSRLLNLSKFLPLPLTYTSNYTYTKHVRSYHWYILKCNQLGMSLFIAHKKICGIDEHVCQRQHTTDYVCVAVTLSSANMGPDYVGVNVPSRNQLEQGNKKEWRERVKIIWFTILVSVTFLFSCDLYTNILWKHWKKWKYCLGTSRSQN